MLTKDLVQVTTRNGKIFPRFYPADDAQSLTDAKVLCDFFSTVVGRNLGEIEDELKNICKTPKRRAMAKLLMERCEVAEPDPSVVDFRWSVFEFAERLRVASGIEFSDFNRQLSAKFGFDVTELGQKIFSDLPSSRMVTAYTDLSKLNLIDQLNLDQVRTLLCLSKEVVVTLKNLSTGQKREFLNQVKFHRLIASFEVDSVKNCLKINLGGPLDGLSTSAAYGPRLANIFPFIASLPDWGLEANVKWKAKNLRLTLDHKSGIKSSHHRSGGSYIPPEFIQLMEGLNREPGLTVRVGEEFLNLGQENCCFPDFVVKTPRKSFAVELFHGSHKGQIKSRIDSVSRGDVHNLIIGIERSLLKDPEIAQITSRSEWFKAYGFEFNQFPTSSTIRKMVMQHD